jgi:hypothetical protein
MTQRILILILLVFTACKKETLNAVHHVQFSSNISDPAYYSLTINGTSGNDIGQDFELAGNTDIMLELDAAGGDTASVDAGDSLWTRGAIVVDGKLVRSYSGYKDATLTYHIQ